MLSYIVKKHVFLSMSNGFVLKGFVDEIIDAGFLLLFEDSNNKVIVRIDDISFSRICSSNDCNKNMERPVKDNQNIPLIKDEKLNIPINNNEYSMPMPSLDRSVNNPNIRKPEFNRSKR